MPSRPFRRAAVVTLGLLAATGVAAAAPAPQPADAVYRHGHVYTADAADHHVTALAVRDGRLAYVGDDAGAAAFVGPKTRVVDLGGRFVMPGLIDGHMHPVEGGFALTKCNLDYARLTKAVTRERIQACLDKDAKAGDDRWLEVVNWFQEGALPAGTVFTSADLDGLKTRRPVVLVSSFGHTMLLNRRGMVVAGIHAGLADPPGGRIGRDAAGAPTGLLEDSAFDIVSRLLPPPTHEQIVEAGRAALKLIASQGITGFLDAMPSEHAYTAFEALGRRGELTARVHLAPMIRPAQAGDPKAAVDDVLAVRRRLDGGPLKPAPAITVRNAKLFLDGVITAPAMTGAMLEPYFHNTGTESAPHWVPGDSRGPDVYFPAPALRTVVLLLAENGIDPHMHCDGDRAVHEALDAYAAMRTRFPKDAIRAAIAHDEIVDPADYPRYAALDVIPVLSLQWEKPAADTVDGARDYLGPVRYPRIEPAGVLVAAGARIAFGSDWPVDRLDEWFALKVGVTRTAAPDDQARFPGRLGTDPGLTLTQALRAITINAAYELHDEAVTGSLEVGKFADFIELDRDLYAIPPDAIAGTKVLSTVVGGREVYTSRAKR